MPPRYDLPAFWSSPPKVAPSPEERHATRSNRAGVVLSLRRRPPDTEAEGANYSQATGAWMTPGEAARNHRVQPAARPANQAPGPRPPPSAPSPARSNHPDSGLTRETTLCSKGDRPSHPVEPVFVERTCRQASNFLSFVACSHAADPCTEGLRDAADGQTTNPRPQPTDMCGGRRSQVTPCASITTTDATVSLALACHVPCTRDGTRPGFTNRPPSCPSNSHDETHRSWASPPAPRRRHLDRMCSARKARLLVVLDVDSPPRTHPLPAWMRCGVGHRGPQQAQIRGTSLTIASASRMLACSRPRQAHGHHTTTASSDIALQSPGHRVPGFPPAFWNHTLRLGARSLPERCSSITASTALLRC